MAKRGRFPMSDSAGAALHSLGHGQGFVGDHRLQRGTRALLGGGDGGVSLSEQRSAPRWPASPAAGPAGPAHDDEPSSRAPRGSARAASSAAKSILKANS